jgi:hypothetical protein
MPTKYQQNAEDKPVIASINAQLESHLQEWFGDRSRFLEREPVVKSYPSSFFLRYTILVHNDAPKNILIKIRRHPKMHSLAQTMNRPELHINMPGEYNSLKVVYENKEKLQNGLGAIRPLLYLESLNGIVMEERSSITLGQMIANWQTARSGAKEELTSLLDAAFKTGQWLHAFHHTFHTSHKVAFSAEEFMKEVNDLAVRLETASRKTISAGFICGLFSKKTPPLEFKGTPYSITHGDMTCDNVLYTSEKTVFVVDIKSKPAVIYSDLGIILIHPETFKAQVLTLGLFIRRNVLKEYQKAVLDGYFGNIPADEALLNLYCAMNFLDKWVTYEEVFYKLKSIKRLIAWLIAPVFRLYFLAHTKKHLTSLGQEINS